MSTAQQPLGAGRQGPNPEFDELDCSAVLSDVWLMLDGEINGVERERLQEHLSDCSACFEQYGVEEQLKSLLARKCGNEHAPQGLRERLVVQLQQIALRSE